MFSKNLELAENNQVVDKSGFSCKFPKLTHCSEVRKLTNGKKVKKQSHCWYIKYRDAEGIERRVKAFKDKAASQQFAAKLEKEAELAKKYYDDARSILETKVQERPEDVHSTLGIAYAGLGRKEDAIREGKIGVKLLPVTKEAYRGLYRVQALAKIYVMVGEFDAAIDQLEFLLARPGEMSIPLLRLDPAWAPLRDHPRFRKLLEEGK